MKIELINEVNEELTVTEQIFYNRKIDKELIPKYLISSQENTYDYHLLKNITYAVERFLYHYEQGHEMVTQADVDVDGYTSSAVLVNYLTANYKDIKISAQVRDAKVHGLDMTDEIMSGKYKLIFVPDAGSSEYEKHKILKDMGIDVIVLDHHEADKESEDAIIVNNQLSPDYPNKSLSGVGIVYKFCKALDELDLIHNMKERDADSYLDLVAIGNIADMSSFRFLETKTLIGLGLQRLNEVNPENNVFLRYLVKKQSYSLGKEVTPIGVSFYIAPFINAMIRSGTEEEKRFTFETFIDTIAVQKILSNKRGAPKDSMEFRFEQAQRLLTNVKNRQKNEVDPLVVLLKKQLTEDYLINNQVLIMEPPKGTNKNLYGLVANKIMAEYQRPTFVLSTDEKTGTRSGSARNLDCDNLPFFREYVAESGLVNYASGHSSAFGVSVTKENFKPLVDHFNRTLNFENVEKVHQVDFMYTEKTLDPQAILEIGHMKSVWGQGLSEPLIYIKTKIRPRNVTLMSPDKRPTLKITIGDVNFIKFRSSMLEYEKFVKDDMHCVEIEMLGKCVVNEWQGRFSPQIFIQEYTIGNFKLDF